MPTDLAAGRARDAAATAPAPMSKFQARKALVKAITVAAAKSFALSAAVLGPGLLLLYNGAQVPGMLWLFGGSFGMVAWTYRKPWRLGLITCLIPPVAAGLGYLVQLAFFSHAAPPFVLLLGAVAIGIGVGWYRGEAHQLYKKDGSIFAQRTVAYLGIWITAYAITQLMAVAADLWLVRSGLLTGAFSTAMLGAVSVIILQKRKALAHASAAVLAFAFLFAHAAAILPAAAQSSSGDVEVIDILRQTASRVSRLILDADLAEAVMGQRPPPADSAPISIPLPAPSFQRISENAATATYATDASSSISVTLERLDSTEAAMPQMSDLRGVTSKMAKWITVRGASCLLGVSIDERASPITGEVAAVMSKDRFRISVRAYGRGQIARERPPSDGIAGAIGDAIGEALEEAGGILFLPLMTPALAGEYHAALDVEAYPSAGTNAAPPPFVPETRPGPDYGAGTSGDDGYAYPPYVTINPADVAAGSAAVAAILIAAGIAANIAQAIAAAIASAAQSGVQMTSEDIAAAIGEWLAGSRPADGSGATQGSGGQDVAPPPKPPPIYDKDGTPFATNDKGQYWAPDAEGNWRWLDPVEAREASAALQREAAARRAEQAEHDRATQEMMEKWRQQRQQEAVAAASEAQRRTAEDQAARAAEERRLGQLGQAIGSTIEQMGPGEQRDALMGELGGLLQKGDTEGAELLWSHLRGARQSQLDKLGAEARWDQMKGKVYGAAETGAALTRDVSKAALTAATTQLTGGIGLAPAAMLGGTLIGSVEATEAGLSVDPTGNVKFDRTAAAKGLVKGVKGGLSAAIGGAATSGSKIIALTKIGSQAGLDAAETYAETGSGEKALVSGLLGVASGASGEAIDAGFQQDGLLKSAVTHTTNYLGNTAKGVLVSGKDARTAAGEALYGEMTSLAGKSIISNVPVKAPDLPSDGAASQLPKIRDWTPPPDPNGGAGARGATPEGTLPKGKDILGPRIREISQDEAHRMSGGDPRDGGWRPRNVGVKKDVEALEREATGKAGGELPKVEHTEPGTRRAGEFDRKSPQQTLGPDEMTPASPRAAQPKEPDPYDNVKPVPSPQEEAARQESGLSPAQREALGKARGAQTRRGVEETIRQAEAQPDFRQRPQRLWPGQEDDGPELRDPWNPESVEKAWEEHLRGRAKPAVETPGEAGDQGALESKPATPSSKELRETFDRKMDDLRRRPMPSSKSIREEAEAKLARMKSAEAPEPATGDVHAAKLPPKAEILDPSDPRQTSYWGQEVEATQQGRGISAEETVREEVIIVDGKVVPSKENPLDHLGPKQSAIQVNARTGNVEVKHGPKVESVHKEGIKNRLLAENREVIERAKREWLERQERIKNQVIKTNPEDEA